LLGARDTLVPRSVADWLDAALPNAQKVLIDGAGHAPFLSHPAGCLPLLEASIDG
jgi:pimeloyl-[acyl-carrier protein] methyl ester esterase